MKALTFLLFTLLSIYPVHAKHPAITGNIGTSILKSGKSLSTTANALCYSIGVEVYDTTANVLPFASFEHNTWSVMGFQSNNNLMTVGFKAYTKHRIYFVYTVGAGTADGEIVSYVSPGVGMEFNTPNQNLYVFAEAKYAIGLTGALFNYVPIRIGMKFIL